MVAIQPQRPDEYQAGLSGAVTVSGADAGASAVVEKASPYSSGAGIFAEVRVKGTVGEEDVGEQAAQLVMARVMGTWEVREIKRPPSLLLLSLLRIGPSFGLPRARNGADHSIRSDLSFQPCTPSHPHPRPHHPSRPTLSPATKQPQEQHLTDRHARVSAGASVARRGAFGRVRLSGRVREREPEPLGPASGTRADAHCRLLRKPVEFWVV
jgi:hypothetical protein